MSEKVAKEFPITLTTLKLLVKSLASDIRHWRKEEEKKLRWFRKLNGFWRKRHPLRYREQGDEYVFDDDITWDDLSDEQKGAVKAFRPARPKPFKLKENHDTAMQKAFDEYWNLTQERKCILRKESRIVQLAYAFLRQRPYEMTEKSVRFHNPPNFDAIRDIAEEFSASVYKANLANEFVKDWDLWMDKAIAFLESKRPQEVKEAA